MDMQWITELLAIIAATAAVFATVGWALWFVIGLRVAPLQQDVSELKVAVSDLSDNVSDLDGKISDLNAKLSELIVKFDIIMTPVREEPRHRQPRHRQPAEDRLV